eukprot:279271-Chlamydomonas_euryale.AAC.1
MGGGGGAISRAVDEESGNALGSTRSAPCNPDSESDWINSRQARSAGDPQHAREERRHVWE